MWGWSDKWISWVFFMLIFDIKWEIENFLFLVVNNFCYHSKILCDFYLLDLRFMHAKGTACLHLVERSNQRTDSFLDKVRHLWCLDHAEKILESWNGELLRNCHKGVSVLCSMQVIICILCSMQVIIWNLTSLMEKILPFPKVFPNGIFRTFG